MGTKIYIFKVRDSNLIFYKEGTKKTLIHIRKSGMF